MEFRERLRIDCTVIGILPVRGVGTPIAECVHRPLRLFNWKDTRWVSCAVNKMHYKYCAEPHGGTTAPAS